MRPIKLSKTGTGSTSPVPMDIYISPFDVSFGVVVTGTVDYTVQHTFDDIYDTTITPTWWPHSVVASKTVNFSGEYDFPVRAIRATVNSGAGSISVDIIQSGLV